MIGEEKVCSLYVNEMHLVVMLMPYIEKNLEKNEKIITAFEKDLNNEINVLLDKTNLNEFKKDKIKKINWSAKKIEDIRNIKNKINNGIIIVNGCREYEEMVNDIINDSNIKIINCIKLEDFEKRANEILKKHNKILNTLGERDISEMFNINLRNETQPLT